MSYDPSLIYRTSPTGSWYYDHPRGRSSTKGGNGPPRFKACCRKTLLAILERELGSPEWKPPTTAPDAESGSLSAPPG